jgi:hypothetical protein
MKKLDLSASRRMILLGASAAALGMPRMVTSVFGSPSHATQLREFLGLQESAGVLGLTLRAAANWSEDAQPLIAAGAQRLVDVVGQEWHTATHTIPSLVEEDWRLGRLFEAGALCFSATELALLFG